MALVTDEPTPPPTPLSEAWRSRPLDAPRGAITIESAPRCDALVMSLSAPGSSPHAPVPEDAVMPGEATEGEGLRDAATLASMRWSVEAAAVRGEAASADAVQPPEIWHDSLRVPRPSNLGHLLKPSSQSKKASKPPFQASQIHCAACA